VRRLCRIRQRLSQPAKLVASGCNLQWQSYIGDIHKHYFGCLGPVLYRAIQGMQSFVRRTGADLIKRYRPRNPNFWPCITLPNPSAAPLPSSHSPTPNRADCRPSTSPDRRIRTCSIRGLHRIERRKHPLDRHLPLSISSMKIEITLGECAVEPRQVNRRMCERALSTTHSQYLGT
jgi:hypothetical protein